MTNYSKLNYISPRPTGWLKKALDSQLEGLSMNLESGGYPFNDFCRWTKSYADERDQSNWWAYEQTGYWVDGLTRAAFISKNDDALRKAKGCIDAVIDTADEDGYMGPDFLKEQPVDDPDEIAESRRWAHAVFLRALMGAYDAGGDSKYLDAVKSHYLSTDYIYHAGRDVNNVEQLCWLYLKTEDRTFLDKAKQAYDEYNAVYCKRKGKGKLPSATDNASELIPEGHGVTFCEFMKLGACMYTITGDESYLEPSLNAMRKLEKYHMLPDGCVSSQEDLAGKDALNVHETCDIVDQSWAAGYMLQATGDNHYADLIEKCLFNAGMGAVLEDFKGLQYFSGLNQMILDNQSNHIYTECAPGFMRYAPNPGTPCCPGNSTRLLPNFIGRMWAKEGDAYRTTLLGPSVMTDGGVSITETTNYPFEDEVHFLVSAPNEIKLKIRVPGWYKVKSVKIDGEEVPTETADGCIIVVAGDGNKVDVEYSAQIEAHRNNGHIYFSRGALLYSLGQKGRREIDTAEIKQTPEFPALNIYPEEKWNYGIVGTGEPEFVPCKSADTFDLDKPLPTITVNAREIKNLSLRTVVLNGDYEPRRSRMTPLKGTFTYTPLIMDPNEAIVGDVERIALHPYGACKLRMTVFTNLD